MSQSEKPFEQEDVDRVWELAIEPSYISEIARKLQEAVEEWSEVSENTAVRRVAKIVEVLSNRPDIDTLTAPPTIGGQAEGSPKRSFGPGGFVVETEWRDYKLIHNPGTPLEDVREGLRDFVDTSVTVESKLSLIQTLSGSGNEISRISEEIMQDVMERQFR
jgi:hypothetical protein